ncbi:large ribosomal subunit protein bL28 [Truepera radiovictrix]|uniref:Ribosomal protein L28 n=1 Tax=Truepera radiovictrix (strain DSM 17093 / CIP 108686 / LMG 22925 / RQ-24) TaxID=649638 RepID=D7CU92_TRURR|nr:bL28 family ribosomal protein [Truepera radiovictrix]ADI13990.1 ribosomal protein L28 [Truepera radiovictrix DSM 17093]WMT57450.1 bL28 family ribosomal protein [Truepera radiovictrix]
MPKVCAVTGRRTRRLTTSRRRGSAKRKGGVGLKKVGVHTRTQRPNLQKKTLWLGGRAQRVWLSAKALRSLDPTLLAPPLRAERRAGGR